MKFLSRDAGPRCSGAEETMINNFHLSRDQLDVLTSTGDGMKRQMRTIAALSSTAYVVEGGCPSSLISPCCQRIHSRTATSGPCNQSGIVADLDEPRAELQMSGSCTLCHESELSGSFRDDYRCWFAAPDSKVLRGLTSVWFNANINVERKGHIYTSMRPNISEQTAATGVGRGSALSFVGCRIYELGWAADSLQAVTDARCGSFPHKTRFSIR